MQTSSVPWQVLSSNVGVGILTEGWNLHVADPTNEDVARCFIVPVLFATSFSSVPVVQVGLTGFDMDQRESSRISLRTENITEFGFEASIWTWSSSCVFAVEFNWLAIGP